MMLKPGIIGQWFLYLMHKIIGQHSNTKIIGAPLEQRLENLCLLKVDVPPEASPWSSTSEVWALVSQLVLLSCLYSSPLFSEIPLHPSLSHLRFIISTGLMQSSVFTAFLCHYSFVFNFFFIIPVFPVPIFSICDASVSIPVAPGPDSNPARGQSAQLKGLSESIQGVYMGENDFIWETSLFWYLQNSLNCWWTGLCGFAAGNLIRAKAKSPPWQLWVMWCGGMLMVCFPASVSHTSNNSLRSPRTE